MMWELFLTLVKSAASQREWCQLISSSTACGAHQRTVQEHMAVDEVESFRPSIKMTQDAWLNQVELWFGKIERDVIARGVFTSVPDLKRKLLRYIRQYNKSPRTVKWKYADPSRHISTRSVGTGH
jgi:hypothetical protein